jgi:hypothetical protein
LFSYIVQVIGSGQKVKVPFGPPQFPIAVSSFDVSNGMSEFARSFAQGIPPLISASHLRDLFL